MRHVLIFSIVSMVVFAALLGGITFADSERSSLLPKLPLAKGERCVEPTEIMRRRHMDFLLHQRDLTVVKGIRTEKYRFVNCLNCHVLPDAEGRYARHTDTEHFCTGCHQFSAVKIDCFQCHADRPEEAFAAKVVRPSLNDEMTDALRHRSQSQ